jgi:hypothetical protein
MKALLTSADFDDDSDRAYALAWWSAAYLAEKIGAKKLAALYADLSTHNTTPLAYASIIQKHTRKTPAALAAAIKTWHG